MGQLEIPAGLGRCLLVAVRLSKLFKGVLQFSVGLEYKLLLLCLGQISYLGRLIVGQWIRSLDS